MSLPDPTMYQQALHAMACGLAAQGQPAQGLQVLADVLAERIGYRLFTVLVLDRERGLSRRYYSSQPIAYPPGGAKPIREDSAFFTTVVQAGKPRICIDYLACVEAFPDHELIRSLECESAINVPVCWNGQTIASLNLLHKADWYTDDMLAELACYAALSIPIMQKIISTNRQ